MAPHATTAAQQTARAQTPSTTKHEIPADQAKYIITAPEMEELLTRTFGAGVDFNISTKSGRWIYYAERKLTKQEISQWIAELHKRKRAEAEAEAEARARAT